MQGWIPVVLVALSLGDEIISRSRMGPDFGVYYTAAVRFLAGEPLYRLSDGHLCFKYSPAAAALLSPFAALPGRSAQVVFNVASALSLLVFMRFAASMPGAPRTAWGVTAGALYAMPLYTLMFFFGQSDAILLALAMASETQAERRPWLSGALWAITILFKPPMAILLAVAIAYRQWKRVAWAAVWLVALLAGSILRYGIHVGVDQLAAWRRLLATTTPPLLCDSPNQSAYAVACTLGLDPANAVSFYAGVAVVGGGAALALAAAVARIARRDRWSGRLLAFSTAVYLAAFLSPLGWRVNLLAALPLVHVVLGLARDASRPWLRVACTGVVAIRIGVGLLSGSALLRGRPAYALAMGRFWGLAALAIALLAAWGAAIEWSAAPSRRTYRRPQPHLHGALSDGSRDQEVAGPDAGAGLRR